MTGTLTTRTSRVTWRTPALIALTAVAVRLPTYLASRPLSFDDGVYGASVMAMRRGMVPYREVWSSQGPLHLPLLFVGDVIGFRTLDAPRTAAVIAAAVTAIALWACARLLGATDRVALLVGILVATTGTMLWAAGQITGDGPAVALAAIAVWCALRYRAAPRISWAVATGIAFGAALATKPIVIAALLPFAWWLAERRRLRDMLAAALAVPATWMATALPWGLHRVWEQSVAYHRDAGLSHGPVTEFAKLVTTLATRDAILVAAAVLGCWSLTRMRPRSDTTVVLAWLACSIAVLILEKAMFANHVATLIPPLALLVALHPPPVRAFTIAVVVLVPWQIVMQRDIVWPPRYHGVDAQLVAALRALPADAEVIADDPGLVWRAGRSTPPLMNDPTDMRVFQHSLTTRDIVVAAARPHMCAVVITPVGFGTLLPDLRKALRGAGYELAHAYGRDRELWLRDRC